MATDRGQRATEAIADWAAVRTTAGEGAHAGEPRSIADGGVVELREVTSENVRAVCLLQVAPAQRGFVAPNAVSFAEAMFEPKAWFRAIVADDVPVGFVMLSIDTVAPEYYLWRFMIEEAFQGRGYGRAAIALIADHVRALPNAIELMVSWVPEAGGPEPFYLGIGFELTGETDGEEVVARLRL